MGEQIKMENILEHHLVKFFHILRQMGVRISSAEVIDALNGLLLTELMDRSMVKTVLRATLCKDQEAQRVFDQAFDSFFVPWDERNSRLQEFKQQKEAQEVLMGQAEAELVFAGQEEPDYQANSGEIKVELSEEHKDTYTKLPEEEKQKIRDFLKHHQDGNQIVDPNNLMSNVVRSQLNYWKRKLAQMEEEKAEQKKQRLLQPRFTGEDELDEVLQHIVENIVEDESILHEDMRNIADKDLPKVSALIHKLTKKLATRISRRYRQSQKHRKIDFRRTIRHNIRFGGTLLSLQYKSKRIDRPRLLLICDVSGSMARYATFVLQFAYGLASVAHSIESFVFSEDVERVTPYFKGAVNFEQTMTDLLNESLVWGKGTNLGESLKHLWHRFPEVFASDTVVLIVSDAKTVAIEKAELYLAKIAGKVKDIIWLNTLPKGEWKALRQVQQLSRNCRMYECYTLAHLEKVMRVLT